MITWHEWQRMMESLAREGWSVCRFGIHTYDHHADFVTGAVFGRFGVYPMKATISEPTEMGGVELRDGVLGYAIHLPTGIRIGVFADLHEAMDAMELAQKTPEWIDAKQPNDHAWGLACHLTIQKWTAMGLITDDAMTAQVDSQTIGSLIHRMQEVVEMDRPQLLS